MTVYISLLAHERTDVLFNTLENFLRYTSAYVVVHIAEGGSIDRREVIEWINKKRSTRIFINPLSVSTAWGNIIDAILLNIEYIASMCGANGQGVKVVFHSSNDMFIRKGADEYILSNVALFQNREYIEPGLWAQSVAAFRDTSLLRALGVFHWKTVVGSQFEGSMYPLSVLKQIAKLISEFDLGKNKSYAKEEIYFPTFASILGVHSTGGPYVYSEVHEIDCRIWKMLQFKRMHSNSRVINRLATSYINYIWARRAFKINKKVINSILNDTMKLPQLKENNGLFVPYESCKNLFAVKRVLRNLNDPVRKYINRL